MGLCCKVARFCCPCCCCCRGRSKQAGVGKRKRKVRFQEVEVQEAAIAMEMEEYECEQEEVSTPDNFSAIPVTDLSQPYSRTHDELSQEPPGRKDGVIELKDLNDTEAYEDESGDSDQQIDEDESDSDEDAEDDYQFLQEPDPGTEFILSKFRKEITKALLKEFPFGNQDPEFILIGYTSHFVAGTDYYLKIYEQISGHYFHVRVYESLQGDLVLQRMSAPKRFEDPILYF